MEDYEESEGGVDGEEDEYEYDNNEEYITSYISKVDEAYNNGTDWDFSELISLYDEHCLIGLYLTSPQSLNLLSKELQKPLPEIVGLHLQVLREILDKDYEKALQIQSVLIQTFCREFQDQKDDNWGMRIMETMCRDLRRIAYTVQRTEDPMSRVEDGQPSAMERAADIIMGVFRVCAGDSRVTEKESRRWGMLMLVNQLFKIYFKINRLQLCKPLIRAIESQPLKNQFPLHQMITYKYYVGIKAMCDSDFREAETSLTFAYENSTPYPTSTNRRRVLIYLIPVKMFLGYFPTEEALNKYDLLEFYDVALAIRRGCVKDFNTSLEKHEKFFISNCVYFMLMKLRMLLFRNLFKKICLLQETNQIPLVLFVIGLKWSGYPNTSEDEVQCILSNLIYDGQIRGYISFQHQVLVIAKVNPFPKFSTGLEI